MEHSQALEAARDYIRIRLSGPELLAQLAEEADELAHAALKLRRALTGTNPTPVDVPTAMRAVREEIADVQLVVHVLALDEAPEMLRETADAKLMRWFDRLKATEA